MWTRIAWVWGVVVLVLVLGVRRWVGGTHVGACWWACFVCADFLHLGYGCCVKSSRGGILFEARFAAGVKSRQWSEVVVMDVVQTARRA